MGGRCPISRFCVETDTKWFTLLSSAGTSFNISGWCHLYKSRALLCNSVGPRENRTPNSLHCLRLRYCQLLPPLALKAVLDCCLAVFIAFCDLSLRTYWTSSCIMKFWSRAQYLRNGRRIVGFLKYFSEACGLLVKAVAELEDMGVELQHVFICACT